MRRVRRQNNAWRNFPSPAPLPGGELAGSIRGRATIAFFSSQVLRANRPRLGMRKPGQVLEADIQPVKLGLLRRRAKRAAYQ